MKDLIYNTAKLHAASDEFAARGIDMQPYLAGTQLCVEDIQNTEHRVSSEQITRVFENICKAKLDPHLPFDIGSRLHVSSYGLYGYALLCSTDYRATVRFAEKYHHLAAPTAEIKFCFDAGQEGWEVEPTSNARVGPDLYAFLVCLQMGIYDTLHKDVLGDSFGAVGVDLRFGEDSFYTVPAAAFPKVRKAANTNRYCVPEHILGKKLELGNPLTFEQIVKICDAELNDLVSKNSVSGQVRKYLLEHIAFGASMEDVAKNMSITTRTLRRHLKQEGETFSEIIDATREEIALRYLRSAELNTEEIAYVLGFSETASFVRAFKRWTGKTPKSYRLETSLPAA